MAFEKLLEQKITERGFTADYSILGRELKTHAVLDFLENQAGEEHKIDFIERVIGHLTAAGKKRLSEKDLRMALEHASKMLKEEQKNWP